MAASILIDDFSTNGTVVAALQGNPVEQDFNGGGILGSVRTMWVSTDGSDDVGTSLSVSGGSGAVNFNNGTNATGQAVLLYDGGGMGAAQTFTFASSPATQINVDVGGLGGLNFVVGSSLGASTFEFDVLSFDASDGGIPAELDFRAYAWDTSGNVATYFEKLINPFDVPVITFDTALSLDEFTFDASFDWTDIGALAFSVESISAEFDGALGTISVVPLPASAWLLLGGLGGLAGVSAASKRRRRKS